MNKKQYEAMRRKLMAEAQAFIDAGDAEQAQAKIDEVTALDQKWDAIAQAAANFNALNTEPQTKNPIIDLEGELDTGEIPKNKNILEMWESKEYLNAWGKQLQGKPLA